jgi:ferredoxin
VDNGYAVVDVDACMGCGVCVSKCPQDAFSLSRDPARGEPLVIRELIARAGRAAQE